MLKIIMICHIKIPHHEGFFVFHNLCSWALSLITTDRINLRNQHCIFSPLVWFCSPSAPPSLNSQQALHSIRLNMLQLHCTHYKLRIEASYSEGHPSIFREHNSSPEVDLSVSPLKKTKKKQENLDSYRRNLC